MTDTLVGSQRATAAIEVRDLRAHYVSDAYGIRRTVQAVDNVSMSIRPGEVYGIAGESGCGKTTLLKLLLGLIVPPLRVIHGAIQYRVNDTAIDVLSLDDAELRALRWRVVSYVPQGSMHVLNPVGKVRHVPRFRRRAQTAVGGARRFVRAPVPVRAGAAAISARRVSAPALGRHAPARDDCAGDDPVA